MTKNNSEVYSLRKVIKGASVYSLGDVLVNASGFFLIPLYTRVLTPSDYGIVSYLQVYSGVLTVLLGFGFHGAQTRYYYEYRDDSKSVGQFMFTTNVTTLVAFLVLCLPLIIIGALRGWVIGSESIPFHPYMSVTLFSVLLTVLFSYVTTSLRMKQNFFAATLINILSFLITTSFTIFFVAYLKKGAFGRIAGNALGVLVIIIPSYLIYSRQFICKFSKSALKYAIAFGFPIIIHNLMGTIHSSIDRIMLEHYLPISELGIYTLGTTVAGVLQMFIAAFNQAYQPSYYQLMESGHDTIEKHIVSTFKLWLGLLTLATCIGLLVGGPFLTFFAGPQFNEVGLIFPYLLLSFYAGGFYYFFSSPIFFFKKTHILPYITGSSAVINIGLNLLLIPRHGIIGAAVATIISHIWITLSSYWYGNRLFKIRWPIFLIVASIGAVAIVFWITVN